LRAFLPFPKDQGGKRNCLSNGISKWKSENKPTKGREFTTLEVNRRNGSNRVTLGTVATARNGYLGGMLKQRLS